MMTIAMTSPFEEGFVSTQSMSIDRRRGSRIKLARPIKIVVLGSGRHMAGRSRDVSSTGMKLEVPMSNSIIEGQTIHVHVGSLAGMGPLANRCSVIPARVVWVRRESKLVRPMLTAGVEFEPELDAMINVA